MTETWITDLSKGPYSKIKGYHKFIHNNRHKNIGGGVGFYIASHLHYTKIESLSLMHEKVFESQFVSVDIDGKNIILGTIYRTPAPNHMRFLENLKYVLKESNKLNKRVVIMGDLNYDLLSTQNSDVSNCVDNFFEFVTHIIYF